MNWETIVGLVIVASLVISILVKSIIDKKKGKTSCSCGGNCGACNACNTSEKKEQTSCEEQK